MANTNKMITRFAMPVLVILGFVIVFLFISYSNDATKQRQLEGQTYSRFTACSLSFPPGTRTAGDIDICWKQAMQDTGKNVKRYDNLR